MVLSTTSSTLSVPLMRMVSPFRFHCLKGFGNGSKWDYCSEGPTDWAFKVFTSAESLGNPVIQALSLPVSTSKHVAQPFLAPSTGQVNCVWLSGVSARQASRYVPITVGRSQSIQTLGHRFIRESVHLLLFSPLHFR